METATHKSTTSGVLYRKTDGVWFFKGGGGVGVGGVWFESMKHKDERSDSELVLINEKQGIESLDSHYNKYVTINLTADELISGEIVLKIDPHFVSEAVGMKGGTMEHIFKKSMRSTDKGHDKTKVYQEIIALCNRGIELEERLK